MDITREEKHDGLQQDSKEDATVESLALVIAMIFMLCLVLFLAGFQE